MTKTAKKMDMINGRLLGKIILFSIPIMLSGILQLLFNAADVVIVGQFAGKESLAAVSSNGALINLIVNLFVGFSVGANVVVARAIGANNTEKAQRAVHTSMLLALICGVFIAVVGFAVARPMLQLMNVTSDVIDKSTTYVRIYLLGAPVSLLFNFGSSVLRAKGDTKRPLLFLILAGVINVGLNILFVTVFHLDVAGVALATIISQAFSAVAVIICLMHEKDFCHLSLRRLRFSGEIKDIVRIGLPTGLNSTFFSISNLILQVAVNSFDSTVIMAGSSTSANIEGFVYISMNAFYNAAITFTSQNYGAQKYERLKTVFLCCLFSEILVGLVVAFTVYFLAAPIVSLYSPDSEVIAYAVERLKTVLPLYFLCGTMEVFTGMLRGMGYSVLPTFTTAASICVFRAVWVYAVFPLDRTLSWLYISYPVSWILGALINGILFFVLYSKLLKKSKAAAALPFKNE